MIALTLVALLQGAPDGLEELRQQYEKFSKAPINEATQKSLYEAHWRYGVAVFRAAERGKDPVLYRRTIGLLTDFYWKYEDHIDSLVAHLMISRAHRALAEWGPSLVHLRLARQEGKHPDLAQIAARSWIEELRMRSLRKEKLDRAVEESGQHLLRHRKEKEATAFINLRLQRARALHLLGRHADSETSLREILKTHHDDDPATTALKLLADLIGKGKDIRNFADLLYTRRHFSTAASYYARLNRTPYVWLQLGMCYASTGRFHESASALEEAIRIKGPYQQDAAIRLEQVLDRLVRTFHEPGTKRSLREHQAWMKTRLDMTKLGPAALLRLADSQLRERNYGEAAALYERLKPGDDGYEDAVHAIGWCRYRLKDYEKALAAFRAFLGFKARSPRDSDTSIDLATWSLLKLNRAEEVLEFTRNQVPGDAEMKQWRLAHRVDALARLGRLDEATRTLRKMDESVAHRPNVRALEQLSAGYEAAIRKNNDRSLWGRYARLVVELSEKTFKPLRGEKLLAAADALSLEGTPEAYRLAYDLYGNYLLEKGLTKPDRKSIRYRRAVAALGGRRLERALEIADDLLDDAPTSGTNQELRADILMALATEGPIADREKNLGHAVEAYGRLAGALIRGGEEHFYRLSWKYATALFTESPDRARGFFERMEARGYGGWDKDRWGYASKMKELRDKIFSTVPPRR